MKFLLDTMVVSEAARPRPDPNVLAWLAGQSTSDLGLSVLTVSEIVKGVDLMPNGQRRRDLVRWVADELPALFRDRIVGIDSEVAGESGRLAALRLRAGRSLPVIDGLLVATASVHRLTLVTRNVRDCAGLGVAMLDPWTGSDGS